MEHDIFRRVEVEVKLRLNIKINTHVKAGLKNKPYTSSYQREAVKTKNIGQKGEGFQNFLSVKPNFKNDIK